MRPLNETSVYTTMGSLIASGGTVTSTGTLLAGTIEPNPMLLVNVGPNAAGAIVATLQSGTALASGYSDIATVTAGSLVGIYTATAGSMTGPYLRTITTVTGGTATVVAGVLGKPRTITT